MLVNFVEIPPKGPRPLDRHDWWNPLFVDDEPIVCIDEFDEDADRDVRNTLKKITDEEFIKEVKEYANTGIPKEEATSSKDPINSRRRHTWVPKKSPLPTQGDIIEKAEPLEEK